VRLIGVLLWHLAVFQEVEEMPSYFCDHCEESAEGIRYSAPKDKDNSYDLCSNCYGDLSAQEKKQAKRAKAKGKAPKASSVFAVPLKTMQKTVTTPWPISSVVSYFRTTTPSLKYDDGLLEGIALIVETVVTMVRNHTHRVRLFCVCCSQNRAHVVTQLLIRYILIGFR